MHAGIGIWLWASIDQGSGADVVMACRRAAYAKEAIRDRLIEHKQYIATHGEDMPEIRSWKWGAGK